MSSYKIIRVVTRPAGRPTVIVKNGKKRISSKWLEKQLSNKCVKDGIYLAYKEAGSIFLYEMKDVTLIERND